MTKKKRDFFYWYNIFSSITVLLIVIVGSFSMILPIIHDPRTLPPMEIVGRIAGMIALVGTYIYLRLYTRST